MPREWQPDHGLVLGGTKSGKTTYVLMLCEQLKKMGFKIFWFTAVPEDRIKALTPFFTLDKAQALKWFKDYRRGIFVFDEGSATVGRHDPEIEATATRGRHKAFGEHCCIYIGQSARQVNPTVREMVGWVVMFRQGKKSAELLAEDLMEPRLINCVTLNQFEYLRYERFKPLKKGRLPI